MKQLDKMNVFQQFFYYFQENGSYIFAQFIRHFLISIYGVLFAAVVGIPVGIMISRRRKFVFPFTDHQEYVYRDDPSRQKHP